MNRRFILFFSFILSLVSCSVNESAVPPTTSPTSTPPPSATATAVLPTHTPVPTNTPLPAPIPKSAAFAIPNFIFQGTDPSVPIIPHSPSPELDDLYINPGAVMFHENQFHMFFNSFTSWPGIIEVGYATSPDGYQWELAQETAVFTTDQITFGNGHADVSSIQVLDDGTWVLYFHTIGNGQIGLATASSPLGDWTVAPEPILVAGDLGAWDDRGLSWPNVVRNGDTYHMYYGGKINGTLGLGRGAIGLAQSTDGLHWAKYNDPTTTDAPFQESDPVLLASTEWELKAVDRPRVQQTPDGWIMIYAGGLIERRGLAHSPNGIIWETYPDNPFLTPDNFPIASAKTWDTTLLFHDDAYYYFMEIGTLRGTDLYLTVHNGRLRQ